MELVTCPKQIQCKQNAWLPQKSAAKQKNDYTITGNNYNGTSVSYDFNQFHIHQPAIQPKLSINQPNDPDSYRYEQEADAVANKVMNMDSISNGEAVQRKCAHYEEEEKIQRKETTPVSHAEGKSYHGAATYINHLSGGEALTTTERNFFEPRFGFDFGKVRIHNNAVANKSAKAINALAYTHGNNIVFGSNQYDPNSSSGKKLLAHELVHTIQQSSNQPSALNKNKTIQRSPADNDPSALDDEQLQNEYDTYKEYTYSIAPEDYPAEEDNMTYFLALKKELQKRCVKDAPSHPADVSQKLIDRITGKYEKIDGDPGEGEFLTPYVASEGQCTIGYGHVIFPKNACTINTATTTVIEKGKEKTKTTKTCACAPPWNAISKEQAIKYLKQDIQNHIKEVNKKVKVDLNQAEFDALVDVSAHIGSFPQDFANYINENWCTDKEAVRERYLRTAITMKDPDTKQFKVMKNFVERRKKRVW